MKYAVFALLGLASAHRHHHHHHNLAQKDEPAVTPDSNRANFEKFRNTASDVVSTEHGSEKQRTSTHAAAMANQFKNTYEKNAATRSKYQNYDVENDVHHRQWVTKNKHYNWAQVQSDSWANPDSNRAVFDDHVSTAAAVVAKQEASESQNVATIEKNQADARSATTAKKNGVVADRMNQIRANTKVSRDSRGWRLVWPVNSLAQGQPGTEGSPDVSAKARAVAVEDAANVTKIQRAQESETTAKIMSGYEESTQDANESTLNTRQRIDDVGRGGVRPARDALGWRMQVGSQDTIGSTGYEPHVYQFVKPNIIYQSNDKSEVKW